MCVSSQQLSANQQSSGVKLDLSSPQDYPMYIEGVRTNILDPEAHCVFFDTEALIGRIVLSFSHFIDDGAGAFQIGIILHEGDLI